METKKNKLFKADLNKKLFTITIVVSENIAQLNIESNDGKEINYHQAIGVIEAQKIHLIMMQREKNMKENKPKKVKK